MHPDKNRDDPEASEQFQNLGAAYEVVITHSMFSLFHSKVVQNKE